MSFTLKDNKSRIDGGCRMKEEMVTKENVSPFMPFNALPYLIHHDISI